MGTHCTKSAKLHYVSSGLFLKPPAHVDSPGSITLLPTFQDFPPEAPSVPEQSLWQAVVRLRFAQEDAHV